MPQGLDAQHSGEKFPVNERCPAPPLPAAGASLARDAAHPASRNSGKTRGQLVASQSIVRTKGNETPAFGCWGANQTGVSVGRAALIGGREAVEVDHPQASTEPLLREGRDSQTEERLWTFV